MGSKYKLPALSRPDNGRLTFEPMDNQDDVKVKKTY